MEKAHHFNGSDYKRESDKKNTKRLYELLQELPDFCTQFFVGIESSTSSSTRLNYAYDLRIFFNYLVHETDLFLDKGVKDLEVDDLKKISPTRIEQFISYTTFYENDEGQERDNSYNGKERKLSSLRTFFHYFQRKEILEKNPAALVDFPKRPQKAIIRLEPNEVAKLIKLTENGEGLSEHQKKIHQKTQLRDTALITLLLGTGIRISECIGLNISDFDFDDKSFRIIRKGGNSVILYFGDEIDQALRRYLEQRRKIKPQKGHEDALFLSLQNRRLDVRSAQNLVKKYSKIAAPLKNISPHKLRSTYGTELYRQTGDIYMVADVLGHSDINTTKKHYADQSVENRRAAARVVKLREDT